MFLQDEVSLKSLWQPLPVLRLIIPQSSLCIHTIWSAQTAQKWCDWKLSLNVSLQNTGPVSWISPCVHSDIVLVWDKCDFCCLQRVGEAVWAIKQEWPENIVEPLLCIFLPTFEMLTKDNIEVSKLGKRNHTAFLWCQRKKEASLKWRSALRL